MNNQQCDFKLLVLHRNRIVWWAPQQIVSYYQLPQSCMSMVSFSIRLAPLEHPCVTQNWDRQIPSLHLKLCPQLTFLSIFLSISCSQSPVKSYQRTSPIFLFIGYFFPLSLLLKDPFLISFSASRHNKKQTPVLLHVEGGEWSGQ